MREQADAATMRGGGGGEREACLKIIPNPVFELNYDRARSPPSQVVDRDAPHAAVCRPPNCPI
jgi:hypothetical protein